MCSRKIQTRYVSPTLGWPVPSSINGGGWNLLALEQPHFDRACHCARYRRPLRFDPHATFSQKWKSQPFVAKRLEGGSSSVTAQNRCPTAVW